MKDCKHEVYSIKTKYYQNKPAVVEGAFCSNCGKENMKLLQFMQEREDATWKLYEEKSPYVLIGQESVSEKALIDVRDPRIKDYV